MNHAADFGFAGEDTPAEERRREVLDRPARRAPNPARGRAIVAAIMAIAGGLGVDPLAPVEYVEGPPRRRR